MIEIALVTQAIGAAAAAVGLVDKIADQVERFITKKPEPEVPKEHRMKIEGDGGQLVERFHGKVVRAITADDLADLPESKLRHITTLEQSMQNHYSVWASVYPQLALIDSPIQKAKVEAQLKQVIRDMRGDLDGILAFLESCGLILDDHYQNIRHVVTLV